MTATRTNEILVLAVSETAVKVAVNGDNKWLDWDTLRAAAHQDDAALRTVYAGCLSQAAAMAADGPVVVSVGRDHTKVWWVATVTALHGGGEARYARDRTEGGTLPNHLLAACEAEDICQRLGSRVARRVGFDGPAAKDRARKIVSGV